MKTKTFFLMLFIGVGAMAQQTITYDLYVRDTLVNFTGKVKKAIAVNGQIPMPTLTFNEGDSVVVRVHNFLKEETSFHWHGLLVPNEHDGVPYLTTAAIEPGATHIFNFRLKQSGTYWYHSHTKLQEQSGMYGALLVNKTANDTLRREYDNIPYYPVLLSDWTDEKPYEVHRKLHNASDWYAIKKGTTQSYAEAIHEGHFKTKFNNEWKRMLAMDVSDVYYNKFLINGKDVSQIARMDGQILKGGDKIRLRIANGGASTYFWLNYAGGKMTVVANDGMDVEPVEVDRLIISVSETYDVVIEIPEDGSSYEFKATAEDRTGSASIYFGDGVKKTLPPLPKLKYFEGMQMMNDMMNMDGTMNDMGMEMSLQQMDMNVVMYPEITGPSGKDSEAKMMKSKMVSGHRDHDMHEMEAAPSDLVTLNYGMLKSPIKTTLPKNVPSRELVFELTGNMNRYVWSLDNKTLSETDKILIKQGENIKIILKNSSMMRHPMHLHGHFFRVLNGQGEYAPLKNVLDILPMETDTLEFTASEKYGDWYFHCHILYHMMSGMGRVFRYEGTPPNPQLPNKKWADRQVYKDDREFHFMVQNDFASNGNDGMAMLANTRWSIGTEWRLGYTDMHGYETETHIGRLIGKNQWFMPFIGFDWRYRKMGTDDQEKNLFGQSNTKDNRAVLSLGAEYTLPWLLVAQGEVFTDGNVRFQLMREDIPLSKRLRMGLMVNTDKEYMAGLSFITTKNLSLSTHYDSDMGFGAGFTLTY